MIGPGNTTDDAVIRSLHELEMACFRALDNALGVEMSEESLLGAVRRVSNYQEKEIAASQKRIDERVVRGEVTPIDCKMGCWYCCTQMIAVTIPEVLRLVTYIRSNWTENKIQKLNERMASYMKATEAWHNGDHSRKPRHVCPLLRVEDGACDVWLERPLICRAYNSADHKACIAKKDDSVNDPPIPQYQGQFHTAMSSRTGARRALKKHGLDHDLHEMIPALIIALECEDAAEKYLAGSNLFESTKVPGRDLQ
jgi:Fe-S-cluster containining protein